MRDYESRALPLSYGGDGPKVSHGLFDTVLHGLGATPDLAEVSADPPHHRLAPVPHLAG